MSKEDQMKFLGVVMQEGMNELMKGAGGMMKGLGDGGAPKFKIGE